MALTKVAGDILDPGLSIAGVVTATAFDGPFRGGSSSDIIAGVGTFTELDVNGNVDISGNLIVHGTQTTLNTTLRNVELLRVAANSSTAAGIITQTGSGDILNLFDGTTEVFTVLDGGNVGIGTNNPSKQLSIYGDSDTCIRVTSSAGGAASLQLGDTTDTVKGAITFLNSDHSLRIRGHNNTDRMVITSAGNVGIATDAPQTELEVYSNTSSDITIHSARTSGTLGGINFANGASATGIVTAQYFVGTAGHHYWHCNGTERLKLENDGDLTITGVDNAELKLKCGSSSGNNILAFLNSAGATKGRIFYDSDHSFMVFNTDGTATERMRITNVGSVGVTTSDPHGRLHISDASGTDAIVVERAGAAGGDSKWGIKPYAKGLYFRSNSDNSSTFNSRDRFALLWDGTDSRGSDVAFFGTAAGVSSCTWDASANSLIFKDDSKAVFGDGSDLQISHNAAGSGSDTIDSSAGYLYINTDALRLNSNTSGWNYLRADKSDGVLKLYKSNSEKLATSDTGISVTGEVATSQDYPNYRPEFDFNFAAVKKLDPRMTFTRTGEASYHDGIGSVKFASNDQPRFDHDIITGECKGLLVEPAGTNYSWYSRRFDIVASGSWVPQNGGATPTITANTHTAPDGTSSGIYMADTISGATGTAFNGNVVQQQHTAGANVKHTFSMYIKLITATRATLYIRDGATGSLSLRTTSSTNKDWQRVHVTSSAALTNSTVHSFYIGNANGTIAVWGSQIERSSYVSSYIKTEGGANGTRVADFPRLEDEEFNDMISQETGTLIAEFDNQSNDGYVLSIDNGAPKIGMVNSDSYQLAGKNDSGGSLGTTDNGTVLDGTNKFALAYEVDNAAISINGNTATVDSGSGSFSPLPTTTRLWFGLREGQYDHLGGAISRVIYYKQRLSNSQLKTLTS